MTEIDCRRLGLRCVDCLPRSRWCDLCIERHPNEDELFSMYDIARIATDATLGDGTYAEINAGNPNPGVQRAIIRWREGRSGESERL